MREIPRVCQMRCFSLFCSYRFALGRCALAYGIRCVRPGHQIKNPCQQGQKEKPSLRASKTDSISFSREELAQSCGQGISSSSTSKLQEAGDIRKPLDNSKVQVLKR